MSRIKEYYYEEFDLPENIHAIEEEQLYREREDMYYNELAEMQEVLDIREHTNTNPF